MRFHGGATGPARQPATGAAAAMGQAVLVSIRPERIRLTHGGGVAAVVEGCAFLGRHVRYGVQALRQAVAVSTTEWSAAACFAPGSAVGLEWNDDDAQTLAAAPADEEQPPA